MEHPNTVTPTPLRSPPSVVHVTQLSRDSGCTRSLNWRCDLPMGFEAGALESDFVKRGYRSRSQHPALKVFRHPEGHELAWVVTTGRVQIRVAVAVDVTEREEAARDLYGDLVNLVGQLS